MNSEMGDRRWFWGGVGLQLATGYTVAFLVYQIGTLITEGTTGTGFLPGALVVAAFVLIIISLCSKADKAAAVK